LAKPGGPPEPATPGAEAATPRFLLTAVDKPIATAPPPRLPVGVILVTEDARGVADLAAADLRRSGAQVVLLSPGAELAELGPGAYRVSLGNPRQVAKLIERVRERYGRIGGLLHLAPLGGDHVFDQLDLNQWRERLGAEVKGLFHLAKEIADDVRSAPGGFVVACTALDGAFGCRRLDAHAFPGSGGVVGLVKTLGVEWTGTRCVAVDVDPADSAQAINAAIAQELGAEDGEIEVGWTGGRRVALRVRPAPLDEGGDAPRLDRESVLLVTGGARGITAEVAEELAWRYRPTLVLVGRSPLPAEQEPEETAGCETPRELKAALIAEASRSDGGPRPAKVESLYQTVLRDREVRRRIAAMRAAGATVIYRQVDVRDARAFSDLIGDLYGTYGRIDGVIHGAGVIEDRLLSDKTPESFDRVFDTKVDSAFLLARTLRPEGLAFLVFFSSVAGRFANRGQADYVAANEVLNKLARRLDHEWPGRVVALNWGPWGGSGMLTEGAARQFGDRGVHLVDPAAGRRSFVREIASGGKGEAEVVLGSGPWAEPGARRPGGAFDLPLLKGARASVTALDEIPAARTAAPR
jgi:NAD(P)-dependent dehydrogenase (short-subunit alcohol dehydrogenase family)